VQSCSGMPKKRDTCQDSQLRKEGNNSIAYSDENADKALLHNYLLDRIKSQDDAAKQLTSVNALLIAGYLAVLMNSQSLIIVRDILNLMPFPKYLEYTPVFPIFLWLINMYFCSIVLNPKTERNCTSLNTKKLIDIAENKHRILKVRCYPLTIIGLIVVFVIVMLAIPYQLSDIAITWNNRGIDLINEDKYNEAIQALDKAIEINPRYPDAWHNRGNALYYQGEYGAAINAYDRAIEINPQYAEAWYNKGLAVQNLGDKNEAIKAFDKAIEINPQYAEAWYNKGLAAQNLGDKNEAIKAFDMAIEINPQYAEAWCKKGIIYYNFGMYDESKEALDKAIEINPNYGEALKYKADAIISSEPYDFYQVKAIYDKAKESGYSVPS
jgi:tetratricopeptide (TPR) repeat protein